MFIRKVFKIGCRIWLYSRGAFLNIVYVTSSPGVVQCTTDAAMCFGPVLKISVDFKMREIRAGIGDTSMTLEV